MYALVDCNNFYSSVERVFRPSLEGKPIIVLSNNDGCVISRSNESKEIGIKMGAPYFELHDIIIQEQINVFSSNYPLLGDMSNRVMDTLRIFTPDVEVYSIDEAFLKFDGFDKFYDLHTIGLDIHSTVKKNVGIPVSIGYGPTKSLAKMANKFAKKYPAISKNVCVLDTEEKIVKALRKTEIKDVWGIGRQIGNKLMAMGVNTAYDYTKLPEDFIRKNWGVVGLRLKRDLEGIPNIGPEDVKPKKGIANTRSFEKPMTTKEQLRERVATFTATCAESLRKQNSNAQLITVFIHTSPFRKEPQYYNSITVATDFATSSTFELMKFSQIALDRIWKPGYLYKKAGVIVSGITQDDSEQLNLFRESNPKHRPIMQAIDTINSKNGKDTVTFGVQHFEKKKKWMMAQNHLSPCYTTRLSDIPVLKCF